MSPCFVTDEQDVAVTFAGVTLPLRRVRVAATYLGSSPDRLRGAIVGFLPEAAAAGTRFAGSTLLVGGDPLYEHLQAGDRTVAGPSGAAVADGCNVGGGVHEDDADIAPGLGRGFWFFLSFEAEQISWTGA
jgi:hypothetical protein